MTDDQHILKSSGIAATIKAFGAELCSLRNAEGKELLWQAGEVWPRHSPLLFPIIGRLKNDELHHRGKTYPMTQHGVARDHRFEWLDRKTDSCKLALIDNAETRARYPFAFRLEVTCTAKDADLDIAIAVINTGNEVLPASVGGHPAFCWPLQPGLAKEDYTLTFSDDETAPIRRLEGGLVLPTPQPTPIRGKRLALSERLFDADAIILDRLASTSVRFAPDRGPSIEMSWDGFPQLGIWSKPGGAPFLCIEPWHGFASPVDFDGEFTDKPGLMHIAPAATRSLSYRIRIG
jgi:galactose mutarotase-like enzyme